MQATPLCLELLPYGHWAVSHCIIKILEQIGMQFFGPFLCTSLLAA